MIVIEVSYFLNQDNNLIKYKQNNENWKELYLDFPTLNLLLQNFVTYNAIKYSEKDYQLDRPTTCQKMKFDYHGAEIYINTSHIRIIDNKMGKYLMT